MKKTLALFYVTQQLGFSRSSVCERARDSVLNIQLRHHRRLGGGGQRERENQRGYWLILQRTDLPCSHCLPNTNTNSVHIPRFQFLLVQL